MKRIVSFLLLIVVYVPLLIMYPVIITGRRNIRRKGSIMLCANHQSNMDPIIYWSRIFRRRFKYMAKDSLFKNRFIGYILSCVGAYPINRSSTDMGAIKKTISLLKNGKALSIFPEGTRLKTSESNELKSGAIVFSLKTGTPIVPAFFRSKVRLFRFSRLVIGKEFDLAQELGYCKGDKITPEIINAGIKILHDKMFELNKTKEKRNNE